jgi:hypothetical protein
LIYVWNKEMQSAGVEVHNMRELLISEWGGSVVGSYIDANNQLIYALQTPQTSAE